MTAPDNMMWDSAAPAAIPDDAQIVAPYCDGIYAWPELQLERFRGRAKMLFVTVEGNPGAPCFDLEAGCCTVAEVVAGMHERRRQGKPSVVYTYLDNWLPAITELDAAGLTQPPAYWWIAHPAEQVSSSPLGVGFPPTSTFPALGKRLRAVGFQYAWGPPTGPTCYNLSAIDLATFPSVWA